jgi:hypothetical protein
MENSTKQARWLLAPVFGLWAVVAVVGLIAS